MNAKVKIGSQIGAAFLFWFAVGLVLGKSAEGATAVLAAIPLFMVTSYWLGFVRAKRMTVGEFVGVQVIDRDACTVCYTKVRGFAEMTEHHVQYHRDIMGEGI